MPKFPFSRKLEILKSFGAEVEETSFGTYFTKQPTGLGKYVTLVFDKGELCVVPISSYFPLQRAREYLAELSLAVKVMEAFEVA